MRSPAIRAARRGRATMAVMTAVATVTAMALCAVQPGPAIAAATDEDAQDKSFTFNFAGYPKQGPIQRYKGKLLVGSSYPDVKNHNFFDSVKIAIDLTEKLPADLRKDIDLIKVIINNPPSDHRKIEGVFTNVTGVYTLGPNLYQTAPVILYRDPKWVAPVDITYSLVGNAVSARRHHTMMTLKRELDGMSDTSSDAYRRTQAKFKEMMAAVTKSDQAIVDKYRCAPLLAIFEAMKVYEPDPVKRDAMARNLSSRKCW